MSHHLGEDELILHHYGEGEDPEAADRHLRECAACAGALEELRRLLALVPAEAVPLRDAGWAGRTWDLARARRARPVRFVSSPLAAWGALAASLVLAFWLGRQFPKEAAAPVARERILLVAVGQHLERSRMVLVELSNAPAGESRGIKSEQQWAASLVAENRLYRQAAQHAGDSAVVSLLEELERVLAEVAHGPDVLTARQLEDLRARIEARGLLFKVKVIEGQVRARFRAGEARKEMSS